MPLEFNEQCSYACHDAASPSLQPTVTCLFKEEYVSKLTFPPATYHFSYSSAPASVWIADNRLEINDLPHPYPKGSNAKQRKRRVFDPKQRRSFGGLGFPLAPIPGAQSAPTQPRTREGRGRCRENPALKIQTHPKIKSGMSHVFYIDVAIHQFQEMTTRVTLPTKFPAETRNPEADRSAGRRASSYFQDQNAKSPSAIFCRWLPSAPTV